MIGPPFSFVKALAPHLSNPFIAFIAHGPPPGSHTVTVSFHRLVGSDLPITDYWLPALLPPSPRNAAPPF
jgi:hypothetical protein